MTILIDMDDVLEKLAEAWVCYLNNKYGTSVSIEDVKDFDLSLAFPTLSKETVYAAEKTDEIWDLVKPMPGADAALKKLIKDGHEVIIVTATEYESLRAKMDKVLFKYFPYLSWKQVIITSRKYLIKGDVLIDDGPHNLVKGDYKKILFDANHNRSFDEKSVGAVRVKNWDEALEEIDRIERVCSSKAHPIAQ